MKTVSIHYSGREFKMIFVGDAALAFKPNETKVLILSNHIKVPRLHGFTVLEKAIPEPEPQYMPVKQKPKKVKSEAPVASTGEYTVDDVPDKLDTDKESSETAEKDIKSKGKKTR